MGYLLNNRFAGNTLLAWIIAASIIFFVTIFIQFLRFFILRRFKAWALKTTSRWDDFLIDGFEKIAIPIAYVSSIYFALNTLSFLPKVERAIHVVFLAFLTYFVLRMLTKAFKKLVHSFIQRQGNSEGKESQASGLILIVNGVIWILGVIFLIDNLGYNVTTLIAGLGIGGIAIALAAQTILGDLFSYFVIFFDRPFEIGDFITVESKAGVVEHIGIKTTRIRTLSGEQLVCSNTYLTNAQVHNFKRLAKRRIVFNLGVTYQTNHSQLAEIPALVKDIISSQQNIEFDRGHFASYGDSSLNFEFVYYVMSQEYAVYMDKQQAIYLKIFETFEQKGIEFAYPTQTLFLPKTKLEKATPAGFEDLYFFSHND